MCRLKGAHILCAMFFLMVPVLTQFTPYGTVDQEWLLDDPHKTDRLPVWSHLLGSRRPPASSPTTYTSFAVPSRTGASSEGRVGGSDNWLSALQNLSRLLLLHRLFGSNQPLMGFKPSYQAGEFPTSFSGDTRSQTRTMTDSLTSEYMVTSRSTDVQQSRKNLTYDYHSDGYKSPSTLLRNEQPRKDMASMSEHQDGRFTTSYQLLGNPSPRKVIRSENQNNGYKRFSPLIGNQQPQPEVPSEKYHIDDMRTYSPDPTITNRLQTLYKMALLIQLLDNKSSSSTASS